MPALTGHIYMFPKSATDIRDIARRARNKGRVASWTLQSTIAGRRARRQTPADDAPDYHRSPFPAFDLRGFNPIRQRRESDGETAALGDPSLLPHGVSAVRAIGNRSLWNPRRLRRARSVADVAAYHADPVSRAALLARLAAMGAMVHAADCDPRLKALLGDELHEIISADPSGMDDFAREIRAIRASRAAMKSHSSWARERMRGDADFPLVSILMVTKRPDFFAWGMENAARQTYPRIELILAMHGDGFGDPAPILSGIPNPVKTVRIPASLTFGGATAAATDVSNGDMIIRMDDDDHYAPDHIWDLVLALAYSGADLAGKWQDFIYLAKTDKTVYLSKGGGERYYTHALSGGALMATRRALERVGGWRDVPSGLDMALLGDALRSGLRVYRASGIGYVHVRHGVWHTGSGGEFPPVADLSKVDRVWDGLRLDLAAVPPTRTPPPYPTGGAGHAD